MLDTKILKTLLDDFNKNQEEFFYEIVKDQMVEKNMYFTQCITIAEKWNDSKRTYRKYKFENTRKIYSYDDQCDVDYLRFIPRKEMDSRSLEVSLELFRLAKQCVDMYIPE